MPQIESFYAELGRLLSAARMKAGLSQEQVGARLDPPMTRAAIANMETGKQRVLAKTFVELACVLGVEVAELIPGQRRKVARREAPNLRGELRNALAHLPPAKVRELAHKLERGGNGS